MGLHRAAWLLYAHRDRLARQGVLVIGPNRAFLDHIGAVLPALGEVRVGHTTIADPSRAGPRARPEAPRVAALKGDAWLAEVLRRAVWAAVATPSQALVVPRGARRWRVPAYDVADVMDDCALAERDSTRLGRCSRNGWRIVLLAMERAGESPDDRVHDSVARNPAVKSYVAAHWPTLDPAKVLHRLLSDPEALSAAADGVLGRRAANAVVGQATSHRWLRQGTTADLVLVDELTDLLDRTPSLGHVILDEAQDLSPCSCALSAAAPRPGR